MTTSKELRKKVAESIKLLESVGIFSKDESEIFIGRSVNVNYNCKLSRNTKHCSINLHTQGGCDSCGHYRK